MTAHPESVVGRLRALHQATAVQPGQSIYARMAAEEIYSASAEEHAPALLAALEKVWASLDGFESGYGAARREIRAILGPLFESPETHNHD